MYSKECPRVNKVVQRVGETSHSMVEEVRGHETAQLAMDLAQKLNLVPLEFREVRMSRSFLTSRMASAKLGEVPSPWSSLAVPGVRSVWTSWSSLLLELVDSVGLGGSASSPWGFPGGATEEEEASEIAKSCCRNCRGPGLGP